MKVLQWFWQKLQPQPKTLYIIRGVSGSGKSMLAAKLTPWNVAADDLPGLYTESGYNMALQAASHRWCEAQVERWMQAGKRSIAVHNTATKAKYFERYLELAAQYGYTAQIIHAEAVLLPDGLQPSNVHGVEPEILDRQRSNWENFNHKPL